jgi:hypothetical protein
MRVLVTAVAHSSLQWRSQIEGYCLPIDGTEYPDEGDFDSVFAVKWAVKTDKEARAILGTLYSKPEPLYMDVDPKEFLSIRATGLLTQFLIRVRGGLVHEAQQVYKKSVEPEL